MTLENPFAGLTLRPAETCRWDLLALGEVLLRLDPGEGRIVGARSFDLHEGGGEYNVARGLRRCFSQRTSIVTALVDNPVGRLVEDLMLQGGVDVSNIRWTAFDGVGRNARNGLYLLERGFGIRRGMGMMDRGHTAISQLQPGQIDWDDLFGNQGVRWFHTGGIMAALSDSATQVVAEAMTAAKRHGTIVSFDCNYRPSLWHSRGGRLAAIRTNRSLMPFIDVLFGHEGDVSSNLIAAWHGSVWHDLESYAAMAQRILEDFASVKVIASTMRRPHTATRNAWGAFGFAEGRVGQGLVFDNLEILDRVGGGDSFASGLIYGLLAGHGFKWALDCGVAHGALTMTTPGDASMSSLADVERVMTGEAAGTSR